MAYHLQQACFAGSTGSTRGKGITSLTHQSPCARSLCSSNDSTVPLQPDGLFRPGTMQRLAATALRAASSVMQQRAQAADTLRRWLVDSSSKSSTSSVSSSLRHQLQGALLCAAAAVGPLGGSGGGVWADLSSNYVFCVGFCGWFLAQFLKIFTKRYKTGVWDARAFFDSGGMPSSHSALCSSVTTAIAMQQGLGSPLFAVCVCFSVIVMYDAMGVRRHAGLQAELLNVLAEEVLAGHPKSVRKLKEVLGHTPRQVCAGMLLGVLTGLLFPIF